MSRDVDQPLLEVTSVTKYYGDRLGCEDVSFEVYPLSLIHI